MSEVKIVLKRGSNKEQGVWIDGVRIAEVKEVAVYGAAKEIPQVVLTLVPAVITMDIDDPEIEKKST